MYTGSPRLAGVTQSDLEVAEAQRVGGVIGGKRGERMESGGTSLSSQLPERLRQEHLALKLSLGPEVQGQPR